MGLTFTVCVVVLPGHLAEFEETIEGKLAKGQGGAMRIFSKNGRLKLHGICVSGESGPGNGVSVTSSFHWHAICFEYLLGGWSPLKQSSAEQAISILSSYREHAATGSSLQAHFSGASRC